MSGRRAVAGASKPRADLVAVLVLAVAFAIGACGGAPILANEPIAFSTPAAATPAPSRPADPIPIQLPRDDGPHDRLTEWWYYTGHLRAADGRRFGFEAVVFRAERAAVPGAWAAHLALTDEAGNRFLYAQRSEIGPQVDHSPRDAAGDPTGFALRVAGLVPVSAGADGITAPAPVPWRLAGSGGVDRIEAALAPGEAATAGASFGLELDLRSTKPPAIHDGEGFVDFGPAGSSYYYSRTRLAAAGTLQLDGRELSVTGTAWFDHQWGDFVSVGGGGWDWFAINLADGTDLTLSVVRDAQGAVVLRYGTLVSPAGAALHLADAEIHVESSAAWASPASGVTYPIDWRIEAGGLSIRLRPTVLDQELDTRATTGVVYWEGSQVVEAARDGVPIAGEAYVEITRYGAARS